MTDASPLAERGTRFVAWLTAITMVLEIAAGTLFNSMALSADGWHMGTHALALGVSAFAYAYARQHADDPRFTFGTFKVEVLGGYTSALFLLGVALFMVVESVARLRSPVPISFDHAILVAIVGLVVNVICAVILHHSHDHHDHHHDHVHDHHEHHDLNLRAAYLHVLADAATSVLAILALLGGKWLDWSWLDPVMGIAGALLVAVWAKGLIRDSSRILLDAEMNEASAKAVSQVLSGVSVNKLQVWRTGRQSFACWVQCAEADVDEVQQRLLGLPRLGQFAINPDVKLLDTQSHS